jgi:multidrug efflux pump subunit AcrB
VINRLPSFTIIVLFLLIILCGIPLIRYLNLELNPNGKSSSITVRFSWNGAEPRVIEQEVTSKLESLFARVQGVKDIHSTSGNGSGNIDITLDKEANTDAVRFEISTLIRQAWPNLPQEIGFPLLYVNRPNQENERPLLSYTLNALATLYQIQQYANDHIKPALSQISGIYKIEISGAMPLEWQIVYNSDKLRSIGLSMGDLQQSIQQNLKNENLGTGTIANFTQFSETSYEIVPLSLSYGTHPFPQGSEPWIIDHLLSIPIKNINHRIIFLHDIANAQHTEEQPQNHYRINGLNTINILVYAASGENNLTIGKKVKNKIEELTTSLPKGYKLMLSDDSTEYIIHELNNVALRTLFTFFILMFFVLLVTHRWKHVLLIFVMLIGNLSIAVICYYLLKLEIHLYALAGITVSLGLMTDNIIIMSDHLRTRGNRKAFLAILAGTLATISSLVIIFFMDEKVKANLVDFALVVIINQSVSLLTALFVIPALMEKLGLVKKLRRQNERMQKLKDNPSFFQSFIFSFFHSSKVRLEIRMLHFYQSTYLFIRRYRIITIFIFILGFGLPMYMLPNQWEGNRWYHHVYNATMGNEWYTDKAKPWVDKLLGGSLRLFTEKVFNGSYFGKSQETTLYITSSMPFGTTLSQANTIMAGMEAYLKQFKEIRMFQTNISTRNSSINVYFKKKSQQSGFPYLLKSQVISKAIELGGADWGVFGFGDGFNNSVQETAGNYSVRLLGYNYDQLHSQAEKLKKRLMENPRIKEIYTVSERSWFKPDNTEYIAQIDKQLSSAENASPNSIYSSLQHLSAGQSSFTNMNTTQGIENIRLKPDQTDKTDIWQINRLPLHQDSAMYKFNALSCIEKETTSAIICKENQQYQLYLQFDYIGSDKFARKYIDKTVKNFKPQLPLGYSVFTDNDGWYWWGQQDKKQYWLLALIVVMIFFICAILFESLLQPFTVILTIPMGYIGIFLTFYLFDLNFDQGGFAALVMLSGITVNAVIYILNEYNNLKKEHAGRRISNLRLYLKAFHYKIIPILLTVVSTVLGFVPFLVGEKQAFWFALAAGTIGGLLFSLVGIVVYLPLFLRVGGNEKK